ncbi:hypothetical protein H483_0109185 [Dietzia sp. UCD-THP]|uniref:hypothetical protein n=1 Tax=Dietzia sp. UCD-THP TaxID=1292020 RepID=UPI0003672C0D|nr:hypothetical protein [Dietzia sp. UCD-THP]EYT62993.1 hypothetical protein H483_0109185 [Dietzia sp. UCD-THP]
MAADDYLLKSPDAGRMGKAAELLVAATCILQSRARINVSTSIIDDEGVDLVFHLREHAATLAVQVKARMSDGLVVKRQRFQANVRNSSFYPRRDLDMLFVYVDVTRGSIAQSWLVPSPDFEANTTVSAKGRRVFSASMSEGSHDKWSEYRLTEGELAPRVVQRLESGDL